VIDTVANLDPQPSQAVEVVTQAILDDRTGWYHVHLYASGETSYASPGRAAQVASLFALVYHEPSVASGAQVLRTKNN